ncbi:MAG: UvrD-helicase domain-containing protein [Acidimicrobiales bacterium]
MTVAPDAADRELITTGGLDRTLFVEAGAGTGKTTALVNRITNLVLYQEASVAEIAAITFTEAAAAELQGRIRASFELHAATHTDPVRRELAAVALAELDRSAIGTLHSFASRLLSEFAVPAGLPPKVTVLDEVSSQLAQEERWQRFVDELHDDPALEPLLLRAELLGIALEPSWPGQRSLRDGAAQLNQSWDLLERYLATEPPPLPPLEFGSFNQSVTEAEALLDQCRAPDDALLVRLEERLPMYRQVRDLPPNQKLAALVDSTLPAWRSIGPRGTKNNWPDVIHARAVAGGPIASRAQVLELVRESVLSHLLHRVASHVLASARQRQAAGGLEFHDLLVLARHLLRTSAHARTVLGRRHRYLLLDEFQDTDPLQIELAVLVATSVADPTAGHWSDQPVDEGRLFFVGDPKQSIYRFRRADISLFLEARSHFGHTDQDGRGLARLSANFRTVAPVLAWINALFAEIMQPVGGSQPAYEPLQAMRQPSPGATHAPVLLGGPHPEGTNAPQIREDEAADVASVVAHIAAHPDAWPIWDRATESWRPARLDDVTILLPTRTSVPYLRRALDEACLPYRLATGTLLFDTQEVRDLLAVLRAVDDPGDEISLVAALRSPLYGCSDVDLLTYRQAGGRWDLGQTGPVGLVDTHPVVAALGHLRSLWAQRFWLSPSAMIDRIQRERHAFLLALGTPRPADVWRRLRFLIDQAQAFEEAGGGGVRAFTEWAALQGADGAALHEPLLLDGDDAAVAIMTIHGAKGLEFPITILSGMSTQPGRVQPGVRVLWEGPNPALRYDANNASRLYQVRADLEAEMDQHEKIRLLYVAATRAKDHLVLSCHHKADSKMPDPGNESYGKSLWHFAQQRPDLWCHWADVGGSPGADGGVSPDHHVAQAPRIEEVRKIAPIGVGPHGVGVGVGAGVGNGDEPVSPVAGTVAVQDGDGLSERRRWVEERDALLAPHRQRRVVSATAVAAAGRAEAGELRLPLGLDEIADRAEQESEARHDPDQAPAIDGLIPPVGTVGALGTVGARGRPGAPSAASALWHAAPLRSDRVGRAVGRAVHATLQLVDLAQPRTMGELVTHQCRLEAIEDRAATVAGLVASALASPALLLAAKHTHYKELYINAPVGDRIIEGYIDLLIETPEGLVVVDYKTDTANTPAEIDAKLATYELQAATYAVALEIVTGMAVRDCRFVFCRNGGAIERVVQDLPDAMARVRHTLSTAPGS